MKADETDSTESETPLTASADAQSSETILIVDDDEQLREMLSYRFQGDYLVETAGDGESSLAILTEATDDEAPDLLILDVMMPGKDGIQVLEELRQMDRYRTTPVVVLTGSGQDETVTRAFEAGADDFTTKPLSLEELSARVRRLLDRDD